MGKNDKKSGDKGGAKGKGAEGKEAGGKTKGAMSINVRHILVCSKTLLSSLSKGQRLYNLLAIFNSISFCIEMQSNVLTDIKKKKCEKHARKEEALLKLSEGVKFDEVARTYSEDKARQGTCYHTHFFEASLLIILLFFAVGGSLGWKTKGSLDPTFEEVAFSLEPSTTGSPKIGEAKTPFGYHIIMVRLDYSSISTTGAFWDFNNGFRRSKVVSKEGKGGDMDVST
jgi:NIMA-interacting peptidyl-prolyl cis-trans isomerase 4